jgi:hypothetical protein
MTPSSQCPLTVYCLTHLSAGSSGAGTISMREMMLVGSNIRVSSCARCFALSKLSETGEPYHPVNPAFEEGKNLQGKGAYAAPLLSTRSVIRNQKASGSVRNGLMWKGIGGLAGRRIVGGRRTRAQGSQRASAASVGAACVLYGDLIRRFLLQLCLGLKLSIVPESTLPWQLQPANSGDLARWSRPRVCALPVCT